MATGPPALRAEISIETARIATKAPLTKQNLRDLVPLPRGMTLATVAFVAKSRGAATCRAFLPLAWPFAMFFEDVFTDLEAYDVIPERALIGAGYLGATEGLSEFLAKLCEVFNGEACSLAITITAFSSPYQLNETRLPVYIGHYPVGTTIQNFRHYYQMYRAKDFVMYDHGAKENRKRYGQAEAPAYPLERITTPWAIFSSEGDHVADPRDVADLVARLGPRVILHRVVPQKTLRHVDFSIGYRTTDFLHNVAIDVIKQQTDESA
ncbi:lipase lipl-1 [Rhipicephalus sanguineus]|uniref:lipase lipl-1 n=1 Tax=Rhipicephalus sanguineus TaxID=34632 RepID=UPI0020C2B333|nr:lipase lipl-1 [Rhipicephalus sanguineus]